MSVSLEVIPTGTVGAEVKGVDLARVSPKEVEAIKRAWYKHDVLVFRKQRLTDDDLLAFSRHFGALDSPPNQGAGRRSPPGYPASGLSGHLCHFERAGRGRRADRRAGRR